MGHRSQLCASFVLFLSVGTYSPADQPPVFYRGSDGETVEVTRPLVDGIPHIETYGGLRGTGPTFNIEYRDVTDATSVGFDDPVLGATRRATLQAVCVYLSSVLDETGSADIVARVSELDGTGPLATAGPLFFTNDECLENFVFQHLTTGVDPVVDDFPDGRLGVDFGYNWNNDLGPPAFDESDLFSVLLHELTHALGFTSLTDETGGGLTGTDPDTRAAGFDEYLTNGQGLALINCSTGEFVGTTDDLIGLNDGVKHVGPATVAAWQSLGQAGDAPLYAPDPYEPGSSTSHWDTNDPGVPADAVMRHELIIGTQTRVYTHLDFAALTDIGYSVIGAPSIPGDFDGDGDVDLDDYAVFADCLAGPAATPDPTPPTTVPECLDAFDINADNDVDLGDFEAFQVNFSG